MQPSNRKPAGHSLQSVPVDAISKDQLVFRAVKAGNVSMP